MLLSRSLMVGQRTINVGRGSCVVQGPDDVLQLRLIPAVGSALNMSGPTTSPAVPGYWPESIKVIGELFDGVPDVDARIMVDGNAAHYFQLESALTRDVAV
jgi:hypothetical protein